jgi:hypothetical protein
MQHSLVPRQRLTQYAVSQFPVGFARPERRAAGGLSIPMSPLALVARSTQTSDATIALALYGGRSNSGTLQDEEEHAHVPRGRRNQGRGSGSL